MVERLSKEEIFVKLETLLVQDLGISKKSITREAHLENDLGIDSLDKVDLVYKAEESFGINIDDGDMSEFKTVNDYVDYMYDKINKD